VLSAASGKRSCRLSGRALAWRTAFLAGIALLSCSAIAEAPSREIQRAFIEGGRLLQAGDYAAAERIFRELLRKTSSSRIKLELARTLFYEKRYREARAIFKEVQLEPEIPWQVRDNIDTFIRQIDNIVGYVKGSVAVISDTNPENITSQREFSIGGIRLTFQPPAENKKVTGLRYLVDAFQPIWQEGRLSSYLTGAYIDYPGEALDRLTVDMGLTKGLDRDGRSALRAGVEWGTFAGRQLYNFPYVAGLDVLSQSSSYRITGEAKAGRVSFPYYRYLDADYLSLTVSGVRALSATTAASLSATAEGSSAREKPYSYTGLTLVPGFAWLLSEPALLVKTNASFSDRHYGAIDPLFGKQRADRKTWAEVTVRSKAWRLFNFTPLLVFSVERNRSNIDYYTYRKANFSIGLE
jgi:outer membrane protein